MTYYKLFSTQLCPKCHQVREALKEQKFDEADLGTSESQTELRVNGVFTYEAPVLQVDDQYLTTRELFIGDDLVWYPTK